MNSGRMAGDGPDSLYIHIACYLGLEFVPLSARFGLDSDSLSFFFLVCFCCMVSDWIFVHCSLML